MDEGARRQHNDLLMELERGAKRQKAMKRLDEEC